MFSIIVPLYNKGKYVEKAICSIIDQTYHEFELIVVNDGSIDNGLSLVHGLFSRLTPPLGGWKVIDQPNQGVSTARNNGVKAAKYPYICFLDADDWWAPTFLEEMKILIDNYPEAAIYSSGYFKVNNSQAFTAKIGLDEGFKRGIISYCEVYAKTLWQPVWTGATIIKKSIFDKEKGFTPQLKLGEDFDLWVRIAMKYSIAFLNKPLAYYNQDVDLENRAIGEKLYLPEEHMLFTDYGELMQQPDFRFLYERLALYGLVQYYLSGKNSKETAAILSEINWKQHEIKYRLYYQILPKWMLKFWFWLLKKGSAIKQCIKKNIR